MNEISVVESWKYGWNSFKKNWRVLIYATAIPFLIGTLMTEMFKIDDIKSGAVKVLYPTIVIGVYYVLKYLLQTLFSIGQTRINLDANFGGEETQPKFSDLFNSQGLYLKFLAVSVLYGLVVLGGFILLIIPGIYVALRYCFAPILVIDKKMNPSEAFAKSKEMTQDKKWKLLGFFASSMVFVLLGLIGLGVGIVITFIIYKLSFVYLYRKLLNESGTGISGEQMDFEDIAEKEVKNTPENTQILENSKIVQN